MDSKILNFDDIKSLKNLKDLRDYALAQYLALEGASNKIKKLEDEVIHLKSLLVSATPLVNDQKIERIVVSKEQALIEAQIEILHNRALQKELSLDETKKLDLLVKNLRLIKIEQPAIPVKSVKLPEINEANLIRLASISTKNDDE